MTTSTAITRLTVLALLGLAGAGCGRDAAKETYKTPGVGLNPDEIGPAPNNQGGLIEYHYIDFAGAALPLGLTGLISFDAVGPESLSMLPPYAMITGTGFVLSSDIPKMDVAFGTFGSPLETPGACYTSYEPRAYLNTMADVGQAISFTGEDFRYDLPRRPGVYAEANQQSLFPYYTGLASYRSAPLEGLVAPPDGGTFEGLERRDIVSPNWKHGAKVNISFPGGIPPADASVSSVPMPLAAAGGDTTHYLPGQPDGVMMSWDGPHYDSEGNEVGSGEIRRCLTFSDTGFTPSSPEDCLARNLPSPSDGYASVDITDANGDIVLSKLRGQMYTGPWETNSGVTFSWPEGTVGPDETIVLGVRLLGEVDLDSEYKTIARIPVTPSVNLEERWNMLREYGYLDPEATMPTDTVFRDKLACEQEGDGDFVWEVDPTLYLNPDNPEEGFVHSLQGEPTYTVAELICNVPTDNNSYTVSADMLKFALEYGDQHNAQGAVFYFARTTAKDLVTPPVRDRYGNRKDISAVRVLTTSAKLGRFWWER